jgi:hypothetical protein
VHLRVWFFSLVLVASLSACGGGGGGGAVSTTPTPSTYTIGRLSSHFVHKIDLYGRLSKRCAR